jgi:hypothetical protein
MRYAFERQLNCALDQIGKIQYNVHTADLPDLGSIFYDFYLEFGGIEFGRAFCSVLNLRWPDNPLTFIAGDFDRLCDLTQFEMMFFGEKFDITILLRRISGFTRDDARLIGYSG